MSRYMLWALVSIQYILFICYDAQRALHSFPTRRSSDLGARGSGRGLRGTRRHPRAKPRRTDPASWISTRDRKSTRLNSSHQINSYADFWLKKKNLFTCSLNQINETEFHGQKPLSGEPLA